MGSKFFNRRRVPPAAKALRQFLQSHPLDAALSLEAGGLFVRMPWDDTERERKSSTKARVVKEKIACRGS